jgi:hypothetical protein
MGEPQTPIRKNDAAALMSVGMIQSCLRRKTRTLRTRLMDPPTSKEGRRMGVVTYDIEKDGYLLDVGYAKLEAVLVVA